jgi:hypothetical protein
MDRRHPRYDTHNAWLSAGGHRDRPASRRFRPGLCREHKKGAARSPELLVDDYLDRSSVGHGWRSVAGNVASARPNDGQNPEAYDLFLRGLHSMDRYDREGFETAHREFIRPGGATLHRGGGWYVFAQSRWHVHLGWYVFALCVPIACYSGISYRTRATGRSEEDEFARVNRRSR